MNSDNVLRRHNLINKNSKENMIDGNISKIGFSQRRNERDKDGKAKTPQINPRENRQ